MKNMGDLFNLEGIAQNSDQHTQKKKRSKMVPQRHCFLVYNSQGNYLIKGNRLCAYISAHVHLHKH